MGPPRQQDMLVCPAHAELVQTQGEIMAQVAQLEHTLNRGLMEAGNAVQEARDASTSQVSLLAGRLGSIERTSDRILNHVLALKRQDTGDSHSVVGKGRASMPPLWVIVILFAGALVVGAAMGALFGPQRTANLIEDGLRSRVAPRSTPVSVP